MKTNYKNKYYLEFKEKVDSFNLKEKVDKKIYSAFMIAMANSVNKKINDNFKIKKKCSECEKEKYICFFGIKTNSDDGFNDRCVECKKNNPNKKSKYYDKIKDVVEGQKYTLNPDDYKKFQQNIYFNCNEKVANVFKLEKQCKQCGQIKHIVHFGIYKNSDDGFKDYCKECSKEYRKEIKRKKQKQTRARCNKKTYDTKYYKKHIKEISIKARKRNTSKGYLKARLTMGHKDNKKSIVNINQIFENYNERQEMNACKFQRKKYINQYIAKLLRCGQNV